MAKVFNDPGPYLCLGGPLHGQMVQWPMYTRCVFYPEIKSRCEIALNPTLCKSVQSQVAYRGVTFMEQASRFCHRGQQMRMRKSCVFVVEGQYQSFCEIERAIRDHRDALYLERRRQQQAEQARLAKLPSVHQYNRTRWRKCKRRRADRQAAAKPAGTGLK